MHLKVVRAARVFYSKRFSVQRIFRSFCSVSRSRKSQPHKAHNLTSCTPPHRKVVSMARVSQPTLDFTGFARMHP